MKKGVLDNGKVNLIEEKKNRGNEMKYPILFFILCKKEKNFNTDR